MVNDMEKVINDWERVINAFKEGKWIQGTVFNKVKGGYFVKIGEKKGGYLPEYQAPEVCAVGIELPFKVVGLRPSQWFLVANRNYPELDEKAKANDADWYRIIDAYKNSNTIQGVITDAAPQDLGMKIGGMKASLPVGEIDVDPSIFRTLIGKTMEVTVICISYTGVIDVSRIRVSPYWSPGDATRR